MRRVRVVAVAIVCCAGLAAIPGHSLAGEHPARAHAAVSDCHSVANEPVSFANGQLDFSGHSKCTTKQDLLGVTICADRYENGRWVEKQCSRHTETNTNFVRWDIVRGCTVNAVYRTRARWDSVDGNFGGGQLGYNKSPSHRCV